MGRTSPPEWRWALTRVGRGAHWWRARSEEAAGVGGRGFLEREEEALATQPTGIPHEGAVGADDAVARHDDGDRVAAVGRADGLGEIAVAERPGEVAVAARLAVGDLAEQPPHLLVEDVPARRERQVELGQGA